MRRLYDVAWQLDKFTSEGNHLISKKDELRHLIFGNLTILQIQPIPLPTSTT